MSKIKDQVKSVKTYWNEVVTETRKCNWPERKELIESTIVVIVAVLLLSAFVGVCDKVLLTSLKLLINAG
ncbi:MAG: preprotein translocase subunit SecE [Kiritimatiellae bacterium]|nr:preprotein translocase subunit SecE [Kiritimatiellia bacterium]